MVKIPDDLDFKIAALIGCGVLTGTDAALNTARLTEGDAVGLNVIQGARIAGSRGIIAVDAMKIGEVARSVIE